MKIKFSIALITCFFTLQMFSQVSNDDVLFTVDDEPVMATEFIRVYNKNLDLVKDESQKDIDNYLDLFVDYKLKLKEAKKLGLDKKPEYIRELSNYQKQLAKNYLTDNQVTETLVNEAYDRISKEVNASHILVKIDETASPEDTLKAYEQITKLRDRVLDEGFENVQKEVHNGQTIFAENLGYFSAFKMIYKFESAAFNTPVGELSQPFRTRFGYHIVKVLDKRDNRGQVEVGHIMIAKKNTENQDQNPEQRINDIYAKLQQGEDFETLAKQFSEDKSSSQKGGKLQPFSSGQLSSKAFEDAAFGLEKVGDYTKPIETDFGWHIIKLYQKIPIESFDKLKGQLEMRVKRDSRSQIISDAFADKIKKKYNVTDNTEALDYFNSILTNDFYKRTWSAPETMPKYKVLNIIGDSAITYSDFANYLQTSQRKNRDRKPLNQIVAENYKQFLNKEALSYYENHLETENQEFANIINEYRAGLLLFDLMESQIWNAAKEDTLGLKDFYNTHKDNYFLPKRVDAVVASSNKAKTLKKVAKYFNEGWTQDQISKALNKNDKVNVMFTSGVMDNEHQSLPQNFEFKTGVSKTYQLNNSYIVANVKEVLDVEPLSFEDAKGRIITDYQNQLETTWLKGLHDTYKVKINTDVLNKIKAQINH